MCSKFTGEATLLKSHFGMGILQQIYCILSEHLFLKIALKGCFCKFKKKYKDAINFKQL